MKKILTVLLLSVFLFSCSSDLLEDEPFYPDSQMNSLSNVNNDSQIKSLSNANDDSIPVIDSFEDWTELFGIKMRNSPRRNDWHGLPPAEPLKPLVIDNGIREKTVTGYSNIRKMDTQRVMFGVDMAKFLGLYTGRIYHVHVKVVEKRITVPSGYLFFENDSPKCGYSLDIDGSITLKKRGYSASSSAVNIVLTSYLYFVESEEWGGSINREYPCSASQFEWNYILWKE